MPIFFIPLKLWFETYINEIMVICDSSREVMLFIEIKSQF